MSPSRGSTPRPTDRLTVGRNVTQTQTAHAMLSRRSFAQHGNDGNLYKFIPGARTHVMKACRERGGKAAYCLEPGNVWNWVGTLLIQPYLYQGKAIYIIYLEGMRIVIIIFIVYNSHMKNYCHKLSFHKSQWMQGKSHTEIPPYFLIYWMCIT
jgi:hypothetical protein